MKRQNDVKAAERTAFRVRAGQGLRKGWTMSRCLLAVDQWARYASPLFACSADNSGLH
jgi:hypothetical protein